MSSLIRPALEQLEQRGVLERGRYVARLYTVTIESLLSMSRAHPETFARRDYWRFLHLEHHWSYPTIAKAWRLAGNFTCDHTSVRSGVLAAVDRHGNGWLPAHVVHGLEVLFAQSSGDSRR